MVVLEIGVILRRAFASTLFATLLTEPQELQNVGSSANLL